MGGQIGGKSVLGKGSTFQVEFPLKLAEKPPSPTPAASPTRTGTCSTPVGESHVDRGRPTLGGLKYPSPPPRFVHSPMDARRRASIASSVDTVSSKLLAR